MKKIFSAPDVAKRYDSARALPQATTDLWTETLVSVLPPRPIDRILDLGGGTGRFSKALATRFACPVFVLDPSFAMLAGCVREEGVCIGQAWAEHLPIRDDSIDLVWMSQVFHHLDVPGAAMAEVRRVLSGRGALAIRNATTETDREALYLRFFPEALKELKNIIPARTRIVDLVAAEGFQTFLVRKVPQLFTLSYREYCEKIDQRALSPLVRISDAAFARGMERLRRWVDEQAGDIPVYEPLDLFVFQSTK
jgi:ubiquinone/menaquinone biosynthesis C-methylase UbiE